MDFIKDIPIPAVDAIFDGLTELDMAGAAGRITGGGALWQPHPLYFLRLDALASSEDVPRLEVPSCGLRWYSAWEHEGHSWWALDVFHEPGKPEGNWRFFAAWTGDDFRSRLGGALERAAHYEGEVRLLLLPALGLEMVWLARTGAISGGLVFSTSPDAGDGEFSEVMKRLQPAARHAMEQDLILKYYRNTDMDNNDPEGGGDGGGSPGGPGGHPGGGGSPVERMPVQDARESLANRLRLKTAFHDAYHRALPGREVEKEEEAAEEEEQVQVYARHQTLRARTM